MLKIEKDMIAKARRKTLDATSWLSLAELTKLTDSSQAELNNQLSEWKETNMILSVLHDGSELFPGYAFHNAKLHPTSGLQAASFCLLGRKMAGE